MAKEEKEGTRSPRKESTSVKKSSTTKAVVLLAFCALASHGTVAFAETREQARNEREAAEHKVDNSGRNARDANDQRKTADDQNLTGSDTELLASIRRAVVGNDSLSTYAKNVKIIVDQGSVTLRGPVRTAEEKKWIGDTAARLAPKHKLHNEIEISPAGK